ncbi:MAG: MFS transporter, partial [Planctomycetota bacterium]
LAAATETLNTAKAAAGDDTEQVALAQAAFENATQSLQFTDNSPHMFHAAALGSVLLGIYCMTLPRTRPPAAGEPMSLRKVLGVDAWSMLRQPAFLIFAIASFLVCIPLAGYYAKGYGFVSEMGVTLFGSTTGAMSTGQMSEIFFMLVMPLFFARLGVKWMLAVGMLAWVVRYVLWGFAADQIGLTVTVPIFIGILLHGICYDFFFVTGMIYTDKKAPKKIRGQAQALIVMLTQGLGLGIGAQLFTRWASYCETTVGDNTTMNFGTYWYGPAAFALVVMLGFIALFYDRTTESPKEAQ